MVHIIREFLVWRDTFISALRRSSITSVEDIFIFITHSIPNDPKHFTNSLWCLLHHWTVKNGYDVGSKWFWSKSTGQAWLLWKCHEPFSEKEKGFHTGLESSEKAFTTVWYLHEGHTAVWTIITQTDFSWWSHNLKYFLATQSGEMPTRYHGSASAHKVSLRNETGW